MVIILDTEPKLSSDEKLVKCPECGHNTLLPLDKSFNYDMCINLNCCYVGKRKNDYIDVIGYSW